MIDIKVIRENVEFINDQGDYDVSYDDVLKKSVKSYDHLIKELTKLGKSYDWDYWADSEPEVSEFDSTPIYSKEDYDRAAGISARYSLHLDPDSGVELSPRQIKEVEYALGMLSGHLYDIPEEPVYKVLTYKYNLERYVSRFYEAKLISGKIESQISNRLKLDHKPVREGTFNNGFNFVTIFVLPENYSKAIPKRTRVSLSRDFRFYVTLEVSEMTHTALNKHLDRYGAKKLTKPIRMASPQISLSDVKRYFSGLSDIEYRNEDGDMVYLSRTQVAVILQDILEIAQSNLDNHEGFMDEMDDFSDLQFSTRSYGPNHNAQDKFFNMYEDFANDFIER